MHIPDNLLSTPVWASLDALAIPTVALVSRQAKKTTESNRLPLLGVMGAFVFAAQMINFPVGAGTSGHLVGGTLLACLLGPWAATLVVAAIVIVQALVFQDGGVLALGANIINMAVMGVLAGYLPARLLLRTRWKYWGVFIGGVCSVLVSGLLALAELVFSGVRMPFALLELSLALFVVNALAEGAITVSVMRAITRLRPEISQTGTEMPGAVPAPLWRTALPAVAVISVALVSLGILAASTFPDGIEQLAKSLGISFGANPLIHSPLADYQVRMLGMNWPSRAVAGLLGLFLIYLVCALGGHLLARSRRSYS